MRRVTLCSVLSPMKTHNSKCKGGYFHKYEIVRQFDEAIIERCERCHTQKVFKFTESNATNLYYITHHIRLVLPKEHPLYSREYAR